jgi:predicted transcriptional regulator
VASAYVTANIDPAFEVVDGAQYYSKPLGRGIWRFFIRTEHGPVGVIQVNTQTGAVIHLTNDEIRAVREKAAILEARQQGVLPIDKHGYILSEYARRRASSYLDEHLSMFYGATNPVFVAGEPPVWQVTVVFQMYDEGPFTLGVLDVDAKTGDPIPLSTRQIKRILERTRAITRHQTSPAAA